MNTADQNFSGLRGLNRKPLGTIITLTDRHPKNLSPETQRKHQAISEIPKPKALNLLSVKSDSSRAGVCLFLGGPHGFRVQKSRALKLRGVGLGLRIRRLLGRIWIKDFRGLGFRV